ncbi:MAG: DUF547 domain-containing protein [Alphaproteobacteria bacterium]|nr:DUF547 domain-containing protein [Alphaproteobacteria bacterium]
MASLLVVHAGFTSIEALFAPDADLWERWTAHDRTSAARVDHSTWSRILATYTRPAEDGLTRFAYGAVTPSDRDAVADYVGQLAAVPVSRLNRAEQRASWINLYNALTVRVVLEHYPVTTILDIDISPGWLADGPWDKALVKIEGEAVTLNDIEHRILRPIWRDPRIHYALNCASVGCPNLQGRAFTADNAEELLDDGARAYVNSPRGAHLQDGELVVSSIYVWFAEDFGRDNAEIIAHLATYATPELGVALSRYDDIDGHEYDWDLNDAAN